MCLLDHHKDAAQSICNYWIVTSIKNTYEIIFCMDFADYTGFQICINYITFQLKFYLYFKFVLKYY